MRAPGGLGHQLWAGCGAKGDPVMGQVRSALVKSGWCEEMLFSQSRGENHATRESNFLLAGCFHWWEVAGARQCALEWSDPNGLGLVRCSGI